MKFEEALKLLREGKKMRRKCWASYYYIRLWDKEIRNYIGDEIDGFSIEDVSAEDWEEWGGTLLTREEERMLHIHIDALTKVLGAVVIGVIKLPSTISSQYKECVTTWCAFSDRERYMHLQFFEKGTRFIGLELNKSYTLEELGLVELEYENTKQ